MTTIVSQFLSRYGVPENALPDDLQLNTVASAFTHLPYENVTKILKHCASAASEQKLRTAEEVLQDHLQWNTGGTCFSLCNALQNVLAQLRFPAFIAMADMHYGENIHCAVIASVEQQKYLLDPGYLLHSPIPLPPAGLEVMKKTPMNTVTLRHEQEQFYSLYTWEAGQMKWRYRLHAAPTNDEDFTRHWAHSFSLNSMENVLLSRVTSEGRFYFRKDRLELVSPQKRDQQKLAQIDPHQLASVFGLPADLILRAHKAVTGRH